MYLLYPLLLLLWNKARIPGTVLILFLFLFNLRRHYFSSAPDTNIFIVLIKYYNSHIVISDNMCIWSCIMDFWLGFILLTYILPLLKKTSKKTSIAIAIGIVAVLLLFINIRLPLYKLEVCTIMAVLIYILLTLLSPALQAVPTVNTLINLISKYSYGIFLLHHVILYGVMYLVKGFVFTRFTSIIFFIPLFTLIFFGGSLLTRASGAILTMISRIPANPNMRKTGR